jgi:hypothetical protein
MKYSASQCLTAGSGTATAVLFRQETRSSEEKRVRQYIWEDSKIYRRDLVNMVLNLAIP